jgi:hypothetical protein
VATLDAIDGVRIMHGTGTGSFTTFQAFSVSDTPSDLVTSDLNGDSYPDLVMTSLDAAPHQCHDRERSRRHLQSRSVPHRQQTRPGSRSADFNRDGKLDVVTACFDFGHGSGALERRNRDGGADRRHGVSRRPPRLLQNAPNPSTRARRSASCFLRRGTRDWRIFDVTGRHVVTLLDRVAAAGATARGLDRARFARECRGRPGSTTTSSTWAA